MIYERYGELRTDTPDDSLIQSMKERILHEEKNFDTENNEDERKAFRGLWEIYYYLYYGLYSAAWRGINNLKEKYRWLVPGDVYHSMEDICSKPR